MTPKVFETKVKIDTWDSIKIKNVCIKDLNKSVERQPVGWEKHANVMSDKSIIFRI